MLHNEFDRFFKDRLKDYSSPVHTVIWRRVRSDWGRRQLFRTRWVLTGGAVAVVVAIVVGYFIVRPGRPEVGRAVRAASAGGAGVDSDMAAGTSHFVKSIAASSVERTPASSTGQMSGRSGRSPRRALSPGGMGGGGRAAGRAGVGGRKLDGAVAEQDQGRVKQGRGGFERQRYRGHEGLPSLAQLSSRAAIYAKPIKSSPVVSSKQKSRAGGSDLPGNLHLDIYGSPDIPTKQFDFSYTAGARMTMLITHHLFISAGLQYSKANVKRNDSTARLYPRYFNNIDLPVLIGYTVGNDRLQFSVDGGVIFNLFSHAAGPVGWGWPNRMGTSAYLGLDFAETLNDRLSLFAEPYGRCLFTYKSLLPSQTYTGGALIGIRYNFMRR